MSTKKSSKSVENTARTALTDAQWRAARKVAIGSDFLLVNVGKDAAGVKTPKSQERAQVLLGKAAVALKKPGIERQSVFRGANPDKVYAYSAMPGVVDMLVREASDGTRVVGKIGADGRFRISRKAA